jgi:3-methyladenine DNA glycosylase Tag
MHAQPSSSNRHNIAFPMLKEHLEDVIDELISVRNRRKINSLIDKFDAEATKVQHLMQQAQEFMIIV